MYKAGLIAKTVFGVLSALATIFFLIATIVDKDGKADYEGKKEARKEYWKEKLLGSLSKAQDKVDDFTEVLDENQYEWS